MGKRWCDVTVQTQDGKRHTITHESASVYDAAIRFFGRARPQHFLVTASLPKTNDDTVFEVRPIHRVTHAKLMDWANKKAEIYARSKKYRKWR